MRTITARDANQNFSKLLAEVEKGESVLITKNGRTVAELKPRIEDRRKDPEWQKAHAEAMEFMKSWPRNGYVVGEITEEDKYGDDPA